MTLSVPGNVLLLGEYAVTEEGGIGAAAAVDLRVRLDAWPAESLSIEGVWPGGSFTWTPASPSSNLLVSAVVSAVVSAKGSPCLEERDARRIRIDSSALFSSGGRKSGFGSSAAVSVALAAALLAERDFDSSCASKPDNEAVARAALSAHRSMQGGAGSGYDVYASCFGGLGMFRGGRRPSWEACTPAWEPRLHLFAGPAPVSTRDAIRSYDEWKASHPVEARRFFDDSCRAARAFLSARNPQDAAAAFRTAREIGVHLGDDIGVSARIPVPAGLDPDLCKAVGAGNELGVFFQLPGAPEPGPQYGAARLVIAREGLTWLP